MAAETLFVSALGWLLFSAGLVSKRNSLAFLVLAAVVGTFSAVMWAVEGSTAMAGLGLGQALASAAFGLIEAGRELS